MFQRNAARIACYSSRSLQTGVVTLCFAIESLRLKLVTPTSLNVKKSSTFLFKSMPSLTGFNPLPLFGSLVTFIENLRQRELDIAWGVQ